jgi:ribonuclease HI
MGLHGGDHLFDVAANRSRWEGYEAEMIQRLEPHTRCTLLTEDNWESSWKDAHTLTALQYVEEGRACKDTGRYGAIHAYTDGSLIHNDDGQTGAGYAACLNGDNYHQIIVIPLIEDRDMTNNRAEFLAAVAACEAVSGTGRELVVHTDSLIVWNYFHVQRHRARMSNYVGFTNADVLRRFDAAIDSLRHRLYVVKVRSHNGNPKNDEADAYAGMASASSFQMRHPGAYVPAPVPDVVGGPGAPIPTRTRAKEDVRKYLRGEQKAQKLRRDGPKLQPCTRYEMAQWMSERRHGEEVSITWRYRDERTTPYVSRGKIDIRGRTRRIDYNDWGRQRFPPADEVDVFSHNVVGAETMLLPTG